jgi:hypothetical protein
MLTLEEILNDKPNDNEPTTPQEPEETPEQLPETPLAQVETSEETPQAAATEEEPHATPDAEEDLSEEQISALEPAQKGQYLGMKAERTKRQTAEKSLREMEAKLAANKELMDQPRAGD